MIRNIEIRTISQKQQRYETAGDYWTDRGGIEQVRASYLPDWRHSILIAIHELLETILLHHRGISEPDVLAFDMMFEKERSEGLHDEDAEPGDDPRAPYRQEHRFSENIERMLAHELGINWNEYEKEIVFNA